MQHKARTLFAVAAMICLVPLAALALTPYSQDFELLLQPDPAALSGDGWIVYGNVFTPLGVWMYGYGTYPAPNDGLAFCQIDMGQGGVDQGNQQLVIFNDYQNADHALLNIVESNVFQEQTVTALDVGTTWKFEYQAKLGNITGDSTAKAFIKTIDPSDNWAMTNFVFVEMTNTPVTWMGYSLSLYIDAGLDGQLLQIGFLSTATNYESSGIFYDNLVFNEFDPTDVPDSRIPFAATLHPNYPNPFNPQTKIDFTLDMADTVDLSVFDLLGRRIATLRQGDLAAGDHHVVWDGRSDAGQAVAAGQYRYVLKTATGETSRSMILVK